MNFLTNLTSNTKKLIKIGIAVVLVLIIVLVGYSNVNSINSEGVSRETDLVAQYKDNQNELSTYILQFKETLGIADRGADKLDEILLNAVKGRYGDDANGVDPTGGTMFSAISEAYPDLTATSGSYEKVQDAVISGRNAYKNKQTKLLSMISEYSKWTDTGLIKKHVIASLGFPSDSLRVTDAGVTYKGEDALERIESIVLTDDAVDAYEDGTMDPLITPSE